MLPQYMLIFEMTFPGLRQAVFNTGPSFQRLDNAIHPINHYPADSVVCFVNTYPLDSVIQPLNNWGQNSVALASRSGSQG